MGGKQSHLKASSPLVTPNDQILLLQLPKELRLHCLSFMSERDLRTLASTCVRLQKIVSEYLSNPKYFPLIFGSVSSLAYPLSASMSKSLREPYNEVLSASRTADDFLWSIGTILYPHQKSISITLHEALPLFSVAYKVAFAHLLGRKRETLTYRCLEEESAISAESWSDLQQLALFIPLFDQRTWLWTIWLEDERICKLSMNTDPKAQQFQFCFRTLSAWLPTSTAIGRAWVVLDPNAAIHSTQLLFDALQKYPMWSTLTSKSLSLVEQAKVCIVHVSPSPLSTEILSETKAMLEKHLLLLLMHEKKPLKNRSSKKSKAMTSSSSSDFVRLLSVQQKEFHAALQTLRATVPPFPKNEAMPALPVCLEY